MDDQRDDPRPLDATVEARPDGWTVRLPLWAEAITVRKETVIRERVGVRRDQVTGTTHLTGTVRREVARVRTQGDVGVAPADPAASTTAVRPRRRSPSPRR